MKGSFQAGIIERSDIHNSKKFNKLKSKYKNKENQPCICLLCGYELNILTHVHAEKHGYKNKYEMMEAGVLKWK